jgi:PQQ enzyme repeat
LRVDKPQLLATSNVLLLELGAWLNDHILTFYGDGVLYAIDISTGAVATIAQTGAYTRVIAVVSVDG